jgi:hypothetical protein
MTDAVIGVAKGYGWPELRNYAVSLAKCGFAGEKILFVDGVSEEALANLRRLGFTLVPYTNPDSIRDKKCGSHEDGLAWGFFGRWRYRPVIDYITPRIEGFRYIVWCDVRDVVFQTDPAEWLAENLNGAKLIGATEGFLIGDQQHNADWAQRTSPKDYEWLRKEEVLCVGTFAGEARTMLDAFKHMFWLHETVEDPEAFDQGLWNLLARTSPFKEVYRTPKLREGFCATGWPSKNLFPGMRYVADQSPVYCDDMVAYAPETGVPFSIVHQYDREPAWANKINEIMARVEKSPIILIFSCNAWRTNGVNQAARDTWLKDLDGRIEHRFVLGQECKNPGPDELVVDSDDDYRSLPYKMRAARRWATANGYGYSFHCGSDTYIIASRFPAEDYEAHDYLGYIMDDGHRLCKDRLVDFAQGGAGYWLSPRAAAFVEKAEIPEWVKFADDVLVGDVLFKNGVQFSHDEGYWPRRGLETEVPKHDYGDIAWKTFHLSLWQGEPKYRPEWMHEVHKLWGGK